MSQQDWKTSDMLGLWKTALDANDDSRMETLGAIRRLADGRTFRYVKMTGSAAAEGKLMTIATKVSITSTATGGSSAEDNIVTDSAGAMTPNAYVGYYFQCATAGTGSVTPRKIIANTATTITLEKALATACATDSAEIVAPKGVVKLSPIDDLDQPVSGVAQGVITENYFGWIQIKGFGSLLSTSALTEGDSCSPGGATTAGQAADRAAADDGLIGYCVAAAGSNECQLVDLNIAE